MKRQTHRSEMHVLNMKQPKDDINTGTIGVGIGNKDLHSNVLRQLPQLSVPQQNQNENSQSVEQTNEVSNNSARLMLRNSKSQGRLSFMSIRSNRESIHEQPSQQQQLPRTLESIQKTEKELVKAKYLNSQLLLSQRKREEMIGFILEENRKLRAEIDSLTKEAQKKDTLIKTLQKKIEDEQVEKDNLWIKLKSITLAKNIEGSCKGSQDVGGSGFFKKLTTIQSPLQNTTPLQHKATISPPGHNNTEQIQHYQTQIGMKEGNFKSQPTLATKKTSIGIGGNGVAKKVEGKPLHSQLDDHALIMRWAPGMRSGYLDKKDSNELSMFDYFGKSSVLRFTHEQIEEVLQNDKIKFLKRLLDSSEGFREEIMNCSDFKIEDYLLTFKAMLNDIHRISHLLLRLKTLLLSSYSISKNISLTEALEKIVDATCGTLECDRASVFMVDELTGELWTKVAKGSDLTIRIPMTAGIVGYVVTNNVMENIEDAYKDNRFNKEVDKKNNYRTKTILCVPIRDQYGSVIGACQAINKLNQPRFTSDDEYIFETLALNAGIILRNQIQYDQSIVFQHKLRNLITIGTKLSGKNNVFDIMRVTEKMLAETFRVERAYIYLVDYDKKTIMRYTDTGDTKIFPINTGLIGLAIQRKELLSVMDAYNHQAFNGMVDIDTSMPILVKPIMASDDVLTSEEMKITGENIKNGVENPASGVVASGGVKVLACLEVINKMGVVGRSTRNKANVDPIDGEMLELFEKQFRAALITAQNMAEFSKGQ